MEQKTVGKWLTEEQGRDYKRWIDNQRRVKELLGRLEVIENPRSSPTRGDEADRVAGGPLNPRQTSTWSTIRAGQDLCDELTMTSSQMASDDPHTMVCGRIDRRIPEELQSYGGDLSHPRYDRELATGGMED